MVESTETASPLSREFLPELLRVVAQGGDEQGVTWNVVESLELLIDAGAVRDAHALATSVVKMLGDDRRDRLFRGYIELCDIVHGVSIDQKLDTLEALFVEIGHGGFSHNDRAWISILLARALQVGVYSRALPETELFRARTLLSNEFSRAATYATATQRAKIGLELAKSYLQCPTPEMPAARQILMSIAAGFSGESPSDEVLFDVSRFLYQIGGEEGAVEEISSDALRRSAYPLGGVARGLAELAIARRCSHLQEEQINALTKALALFEECSYRAGQFETLVALAGAAAECDHHERAHRFFQEADRVALSGGFVYGRGVALLGLFHGRVASGDVEGAKVCAEKLRMLCESRVVLSAFGLNVVAAHQLLGLTSVAATLATKCEKLFVSQGTHALAGQAAFMLGAAYADSGKWKQARSAWKRALTCDELRRAYISSCDRRAALAQASAMVDFMERGELQEATIREVSKLLLVSEEILAPFGASAPALEALGKSLHIHAQLAILAKTPLSALKHLNRARESFLQIGALREVALSDALTGLALLEASKQNGGQLLDEAMSALQRSLEFFVREGNIRITWKVRYYLSVAALLRSQQNGDPAHRDTWRHMAAGFLQEALKESSAIESEVGMPRASSGEGDFSPGLRPDVLNPLKEALGFAKPRKSVRREAKERVQSVKRYTGYLH